jgi:hypothetical protein
LVFIVCVNVRLDIDAHPLRLIACAILIGIGRVGLAGCIGVTL